MGLKEQIDEQPLDRRAVVADLVVARRFTDRRMLQPVQRRLAGERRAGRTPGFQLPRHRRQNGIEAQLVVVDQVLVTQRDGEHPLSDQRRQCVLDQLGSLRVTKTTGQLLDQADRSIDRPQQQRTGVSTAAGRPKTRA